MIDLLAVPMPGARLDPPRFLAVFLQSTPHQQLRESAPSPAVLRGAQGLDL